MIKKLLLTGLSILGFGLHAQTILYTPITSSQTVTDPVSVTMKPGFSVLASPALTFSAKIGTTPVNSLACNQYGKVVISEIHFDTHYNERIEDKYHFFGEYIELFNSSTSPIDLTGWIIKDNHTEFTLTADAVNGNFVIPPGGHKIITYGGFRYYGAMSNTDPWPGSAGGAQSAIGGRAKFEELFPDVLTASGYNAANDIILQNTMVLFNLEDKVSLHAPNGKLVDQVCYRQDQINNLHVGYDDITRVHIGPFLNNGDGFVFNGPMGGIPAKDPLTGDYILDGNGHRTYTGIDDNLKKAIYRSTVESYYAGGTATFAIATASPGKSPQINVPLELLDPNMTTLNSNANNDNSTELITYDIKDGSEIGHSKTYFDDLGKPKVSINKDFLTNLTWGTETVYDDLGRKWKQSFPAPTCKGFDNIKYLSDPTYKSQFVDKYYSDNNTYEAYQATAEQTYSEVNYDDKFNPGNVISTVGGNKNNDVNGTAQWKTGFTYTVPAAQEMYYAFGYKHFNDNRDPDYYLRSQNLEKVFAPYDNLGMTYYSFNQIYSQADIVDLEYSVQNTFYYFPFRVNSPLEVGKIYKVMLFGAPSYIQITRADKFRGAVNPIGSIVDVISGSWDNFSDASSYKGVEYLQATKAVLNDSNNLITNLKVYKTVSIDRNGAENVSFSDSDGKILATARSGGTNTYVVTSLIGSQGYVDIHLPKNCDGNLAFLGGFTMYDVFDLRTGKVLTDAEKNNMPSGLYRIKVKINTNALPLTYLNKTTGQILPVLPPANNTRGVSYGINYYDYSLNVYNKAGQLVKNIQPNGYEPNIVIKDVPSHMQPNAAFVTTYSYNDQGLIKEMKSPDEGVARYTYRSDGQIRYSQSQIQECNPAQPTVSKVSYTNYDELSRPVESGVVSGTCAIWGQASGDPDGVLVSGTPSEQTFTVYDFVDLNVMPSSITLAGVLATAGINSSGYVQENLAGNVVCSYSKNGSVISAMTWYNYDIYDRLVWMVQYIDGLGAKTIHYEYDYKGNVSKVLFQKDKIAELFVHRYSYNLNNVLIKAETSTDNSNFITHADYDYYVTGELKRTNIGQGVQGLDYVYTLGGKLKSINHPSLEQAKDPGHDANDIFGLILDYYDGDYKRASANIASSPTIAGANQDFNGNIKAVRWANKNDVAGGVASQRAYMFDYNRDGWLTDATFGTANNTGSIAPSGMFKEGSLTYDANGNIKGLQRTDNNSQAVDVLNYSYVTGTNKLNNVNDTGIATPSNNMDLEGNTVYVYNDIGQLWKNTTEGLEYFYNTQGLTTEVKKAGNTVVKFFYNERGQRVKKENYNTSGVYQYTDYYVLDVSGATMAIYNKQGTAAITQSELPIYGLNRLGVYVKDALGDFMKYEITDHLGNVRAVAQKNVNSTMYMYADYYPFGETLPTKDGITGQYRYAYQGQELDKETNMEAFQLRLWDGRIGRWLNPDPYGQHSSPYLGMGNNPAGTIDPDGGWETWFGAFCGWIRNGFSGEIKSNPNASKPYLKYFINSSYVDNNEAHIVIDYGRKSNSSKSNQAYNRPFFRDPFPEYKWDWLENRKSGYVFDDGEMTSGFFGDKTGKDGKLYGVTQMATGPSGDFQSFKFSKTALDVKLLSDIMVNKLEMAGAWNDYKKTTAEQLKKDSIIEKALIKATDIKNSNYWVHGTFGPMTITVHAKSKRAADSIGRVLRRDGYKVE